MYPFIAGKEITRLLPGHVTVFASALRFYTSSPVMFFGPGRGVGTQVRALSAQCVITGVVLNKTRRAKCYCCS